MTDSDHQGTTRSKHDGDGRFRQVYLGRLVRLGWEFSRLGNVSLQITDQGRLGTPSHSEV